MQRTCQASRAVLRVCELLLRDKCSRNGLRYDLAFLLTRLIATVPPFSSDCFSWYDYASTIATMLIRYEEDAIFSMPDHLQRVQRVAHRGGSALAPENTLAAFRNALTLPVDAIELDVHMSRDGHAIVFHDNTVERRTNGQGNILDLDFDYLRSLDAAAHFSGGWPEPQQIPALREVLDIAKGRLQVYIEIKTSKRNGVYGRYPGIVETVINELHATDMIDQVLVMSFDWSILPHVKSLEPALQTSALVSRDTWDDRAGGALEKLIAQAQTLGCSWLNMDWKLCTETMPAVIHEQGLQIGLWTVNDQHEMRRFARAGVDSITTDRPDLFQNL
jgi:glycerophosphoryl diester phosphodiesterase